MNLNQKRRVFLKGSVAAGTLGAAVGLLTPGAVLAAWNKNAFTAKGIDEAIAGAAGSPTTVPSTDITIKAPDIAENGAVVPVSVSTKMDGVNSITLLVEKNATPLSAIFHLPKGTLPDVSTRVKMGKTGDVIAVVKANGKLYSARKSVKVTIGGCGG
ncbi:MAG TPA: thiosulfate oxidation carrier protein SoxY [Chromatiaceae bacterium]|nr:thiosulfate oxidation carrier protein SoxY [Chromatiaceae bacterium]